MNVQRESKALRMRINGKFSEHEGFPMRTVVGYTEVRQYLDDQLTAAESALGVDPSKVKVMPYALVVGEGDEQVVMPMGVNRNFYASIRGVIDNGNPEDELGTLTPETLGVAYIESLREFDLAGNGVLVEGTPQGIVFSQQCGCRGDITLPVVEEHFGPYTSDKSNLHVAGDTRDCYEGRGQLDARVQSIISVANSKQIVTLGPNDDIVGILKGDHKFQDCNWTPKQ